MRGVTFLGERKLRLTEFPDPVPGPREVIVEIKASGMCGSDLKFYRGTGETSSLGLGKVNGPIIAGHEPCGVVAATGSAGRNARAASVRGLWCITIQAVEPARIVGPAGHRCALMEALSMVSLGMVRTRHT